VDTADVVEVFGGEVADVLEARVAGGADRVRLAESVDAEVAAIICDRSIDWCIGLSEEDQQQHTNGTNLTAETLILNDDGKIPEK
jgi:hypothetical protein